MNERLKHQCHRDGCDSEATHKVRVEIRCPSPGEHHIVRTESSIIVCTRHAREDLVLEYLRQPQNRDAIAKSLMDGGYPEPDFLTLRVKLEPIERGRDAVLMAAPPVMCDRDGCRKAAKWQVVHKLRLMWQRGRGPHQIKLLTNLCCCEEHKHGLSAAHFRDPASESAIRASVAKHTKGKEHLPDLKSLEVDFAPLVEGRGRLDPRTWVGDDGPQDQFKVER